VQVGLDTDDATESPVACSNSNLSTYIPYHKGHLRHYLPPTPHTWQLAHSGRSPAADLPLPADAPPATHWDPHWQELKVALGEH